MYGPASISIRPRGPVTVAVLALHVVLAHWKVAMAPAGWDSIAATCPSTPVGVSVAAACTDCGGPSRSEANETG